MNQEIADALGIDISTVGVTLRCARNKLNIKDKAGLAQWARQNMDELVP